MGILIKTLAATLTITIAAAIAPAPAQPVPRPAPPPIDAAKLAARVKKIPADQRRPKPVTLPASRPTWSCSQRDAVVPPKAKAALAPDSSVRVDPAQKTDLVRAAFEAEAAVLRARAFATADARRQALDQLRAYWEVQGLSAAPATPTPVKPTTPTPVKPTTPTPVKPTTPTPVKPTTPTPVKPTM